MQSLAGLLHAAARLGMDTPPEPWRTAFFERVSQTLAAFVPGSSTAVFAGQVCAHRTPPHAPTHAQGP